MDHQKKNKPVMNRLREWIKDNFFGLIIFLVLFLIILVFTSLFIPIDVSDFPENSIQLEKYNAGVEQRTILIRSISSIISGVSVVTAFVSLLQSKNSEMKKEHLQVMPFPAYAVPLEDVQYSKSVVSGAVVKQKLSQLAGRITSSFVVTIKNIGLGSLVDYKIQAAYYTNSKIRERC